MRSLQRWSVLVVVGMLAVVPEAARAAGEPWRDTTRSPAERADALLAAMTPAQRVSLALGDFDAVASLGVPAIHSTDGPNGVRSTGTMSLPAAQLLAATFDPSLARAYCEVVGEEARGRGFNAWLGPAMDIARTPLAGRQPENLGEDPFLAGTTAAAEVAGAKSRHVISTLKHYVANNQEWERIGFWRDPTGEVRTPGLDVRVSDRTLQDIYAAPFERAIRQGGANAVMCSYNRVNGPQTCESPALLGDLKRTLVDGYVVPDFGFAVRDPLAAANAGVDLPALGGPGGRTAEMFASGQISPQRRDDIARRILLALLDSGAFDDPLPAAPAEVVRTPEHTRLATEVAQAGMVLLRNERRALPIGGDVRSIAVIGPSGADASYVTGGSASVPPEEGQAVSPLAGITARAPSGVAVTAAQGSLGDAPLPETVPASAFGSGLHAQYFAGGDLAGDPVLTRTEPTLDIPETPAGVPEHWSARWTGTLTPPETGRYRLSLLTAGIVRLYVDGKLVRTAYREATQFLAGPRYPVDATVDLTAGHPVSMEVEYSSKSELFGAQIHLSWQRPSQSQIPAAVQAAQKADVAVVFADNAQGEGMDRSTLALAGDQDDLIEAVAKSNPRTIVVLNTGGPVLMPWLRDVGAVLQAWYPGQAYGTALAAVLFGDADPGGRLPVTFPASDEQGPAPASRPERYPGVGGEERYDEGELVGYRWYEATGQQPLFAFGDGLSYADFALGHAHVKRGEDGSLTVTAKVRNTRDRAGSTVLQVYAGRPRGLVGYEKVALGPRAAATVTIGVARGELGGERHSVWIGTSSRDLRRLAG
jgi:beta-glucosidase